MLHILKPFHCPSCNAVYSSRDVGRQQNQTKFPVILSCNHSVCSSCLHTALKNQKDFICSICKIPVDLPSGYESISEMLPDLHALGIISAQKKQVLPSFKIKMVSNPELYRHLHGGKSAVKICGNCNQVEALWQCDECQSYFCNLCFDKVHKKIKSRKKHEAKKIFAELYNTMVQTGCTEHKNKSVEFYCEKDDQLTCSHCMLIGNHVGHEVKTLVDKNKSCADDLKHMLVDITGIEKRLKYTEHLLTEVSSSEKVDVSGHIKAIHDHFHKLHSLLEVREAKLISELEKIANLQNEPFEKMVFEISGYQKEITSIKRDAESVIENPCLAVSAPYLLKKLESFKEIPCYLLPIQANMDKNVKIELLLNEEFDNAIEEHGSIEYSIKPRFHLVPTQELPENYCMEIPESFAQSEIDSQQSTVTADSCSEDSLMSPGTSKSGIEAAFKYRDINRMHPEVVIVSHVKDPHCFWVQRCADTRKLISISESINKWCRTRDAHVKTNIPIERGDLYLVQFSEDKKWYRGRVKKILEPGETCEVPIISKTSVVNNKKVVKTEELKVEVYYIDFGNSEIVPVSKLRNIQARFLNLPGLAKQCSLVDIAPANQDSWSEEAIKTFSKVVLRKQVIMQIYEERNNVCYVDISQVADNSITNDVPVSVRDALVFQEHAVFPSGRSLQTHRKTAEQHFLPPERLRLSSDIAVIVSHVDSPSHFYVQQISTASYLSSLIFEMSDVYSQENNSLLHSIYAPRIGMICAAQFTVDKQWYRAQVISLPGGANVEVQYVDFGNTEVLHHKFIRKLSDRFTKLNIQAIPCKLADVTYNQEKCWSIKAKEWLTSKVSKKQLTLKSNGFDLGEKKSEVVVYYLEDDYEVCVNALLVEAGLASSCGPESTNVRKKVEKRPPPPPVQTEIESPSIYAYEPVEELDVPISAPVAAPPPSLVKKFPESEGHHIEVHVSHIVNPGSFYIRVAGDNEKKLDKLMKEMQKTYADFEGKVEECSIGKSYAVYSDINKKWYRGTVLSKTSDEKIKVQFVDYGFEEEVPVKNVQKLLEIFTADEEYSICCELSGIIPAGGSTDWSYSACDAFQDLVHPHDILHLNFKGEIDKELKAIPVSLFIEEIKLGGALEATEVIYKSIASQLVTLGLALPVRNTSKPSCKTPDGCESDDPKSCDKVKEESSSPAECKSESPVKCKSESPVKCKNETLDKKNLETQTLCEKQTDVKEQVVIPSAPTVQWKPVQYPTEHKFKGFVTNIGEDGSIQLHQVREGASVVEMIKKALQFKYAKSNFKPLLKPPPVGEACVAKFSIDNLWYRAEVIAVYPEKVKVNFVDYGNNEIVLLRDVRTDIFMQNFAKQCMECTIAGIHTGNPGHWDEDLLNFLHSQLVETIIEVEPLALPDENGKLLCNMVTNCGISVTELLQSMGFMEDALECQQIEENKTFQPATELREGDIFPVCITQINSPNIIYLQRLKIQEPKSDYEKEFNKEHEAFLELIKILQEKAETFPKVEEPMPGLAYCAKYSYDDNWYRCEITDLAEDGVVVLYVDYGNSEKIPKENLRDPDNHVIDFPVQVHFCKIHGMSPVGSDWDPEVKNFMIEKLLNSGLEIFAKVVVPGKISEIELMVKSEDGELELAYEELVEKKLITLESSQYC